MTQTAKLFMNGRSQAVRLPAEFRFEGDEVEIRRDPDAPPAAPLTRVTPVRPGEGTAGNCKREQDRRKQRKGSDRQAEHSEGRGEKAAGGYPGQQPGERTD